MTSASPTPPCGRDWIAQPDPSRIAIRYGLLRQRPRLDARHRRTCVGQWTAHADPDPGPESSLAALREAVHLHQLGEIAVAHPAVRDSGPDGDTVALDRQARGERLERSLTELDRLGVEHPDFDATFAALSEALRDHVAHQDRDEFPLLRRNAPTAAAHDGQRDA